MIRNIFPWMACMILLCISTMANAQVRRIKNVDRLGDTLVLKDKQKEKERLKKPKAINKEFGFGPMLYTQGYGINLNFSKTFGSENFGTDNEDKYYHAHQIQLELKERIHPKEDIKLLKNNLLGGMNANNKSYIYGKINTVYTASLMYGQRRLLGGRGEPGSPLIQYTVNIGPTVSVVKPYYLLVENGEIKYSPETRSIFLIEENIIGKAPFQKGINEIEIIPGIALKGGIYYDFSKKRKRKSALEAGMLLDYYFNPILQVAETDAKKLFTGFYVQYIFGFRW